MAALCARAAGRAGAALNAPRNRRLRPMELAGRPCHPSELGNRYESLQFMQVH
jgi:hypothetical protein